MLCTWFARNFPFSTPASYTVGKPLSFAWILLPDNLYALTYETGRLFTRFIEQQID